jgi:hypothetical protein
MSTKTIKRGAKFITASSVIFNLPPEIKLKIPEHVSPKSAKLTLTRRENGKMVYEYRQYGGSAIELKKEVEVISLIKSYRDSGYSYVTIADILN